MPKKSDFHIDVKPVSITLTCPHCKERVTVPWRRQSQIIGATSGGRCFAQSAKKKLNWGITSMTDEINILTEIRRAYKRAMVNASYAEMLECLKALKALEDAESALRDRIARQNPQPLTLDELRGMDGESQPVYLVSERYAEGNGWKICHGMTDNGMIDFGDEAWAAQVFDEGYVIAYRTKPELPERTEK